MHFITAEDTMINLISLHFAQNYTNIYLPGYMYSIRKVSMTHGKKKKKNKILFYYNHLLYLKQLYIYIKEFNKDRNFLYYELIEINKQLLKLNKFSNKYKKEILEFYKQVLNDTFISEFVVNKANLNKDKKYNYKTIKNYLSNIEDYWNILQSLEIYNADNYDIIDKQNFDDLREDMKEKLEGFEAKRIMNKSLYNSMNIERQKGKELNEIIKKTSNLINEQIKTPKAFRKNKSKYNKSSGYNGELTEDENLKYGNDSLGYQQSSIYYPNNSSLVK